MWSFTKNQNWIISLTSCRLWDKIINPRFPIGSITHKLLLWNNISDLCLFMFTVTYPLISITSDLATKNMVTTNLCFTQLFCGYLKQDFESCCHVKALECYLLPDAPFASIDHFIWRPPTSLSTYCHLIFPMPMYSLTKTHTQKCGNFEKTATMTLSHVQCLYFKTCLNNVNVSKWHFECDPHWSADLTERSRLFICVETNSWCMLSSFIASAVCWVNSAQFFSGKSMSTKQCWVNYSHFSGRNLHLPSNRTYALGGYLASKTLGR